MKKVLAIIMCLLIVFTVGGCGKEKDKGKAKDDRYAKVFYEDGTVETLKCGEIPTLASLNQTGYNQKYAGHKVEVVDTVFFVEPAGGSVNCLINLSNNWVVSLYADNPVIAELKPGTKVKVVGRLKRNNATFDELDAGDEFTIEIIE